jgi:hypothetical protein
MQAQATEKFVGELAVARVPSVRVIRVRSHVGHPRAQWVRTCVAAPIHT